MREYDNYGNVIDNRTDLEKKRDFWKKVFWIVTILNIIAILSTCFWAYQTSPSQYFMTAKPIIYIYPEEETNLTVFLGNSENITCSYPKYIDGWNVLAKTNGDLIDIDTGRELYSLYWEGKGTPKSKDNKGFVVRGEDTAKFLEEKLDVLGLNYKETQEFIIYWLPKMQGNKYNYIRFATMEEINEYMPLEISKKPDTLIRVYMQFEALDRYEETEEQELETVIREGYTIVEWGGTEIK